MTKERCVTIAEMVKEEVASLPVSLQKKALSLVRRMKPPKGTLQRKGRSQKIERLSDTYIPKDAALRAIAGMWKDRTDLPRDPVEAVKAIRAKMWLRGRNG